MARTITVGLDGSAESLAAAEWAAREAKLRDLQVSLVHACQPVPEAMAQAPVVGAETLRHWTERMPREFAEGLRLRHPGVDVSITQRVGAPVDMLVEASREAELLVLGSQALRGLTGFLVGSVGQAVAARAETPVIFVRAGEQSADEHLMDPVGVPSAATAFRPVVLGLAADTADDTVITFAFEEARYRDTELVVVQGWNSSPYSVYTMGSGFEPHEEFARQRAGVLTSALATWRKKYPDVDVVEVSRPGSAAGLLIDASRDSSLVVVGRRVRGNLFGGHIGAIALALLHHSTAPVAVVAHD
ncbi:universal stress protein [Streptomyces finlayi]|uniref:Universal stress protein n=1 Tax=Streptomyces finlayi TaxID=67296 RepID=A0A7G7BDH0_9ACTN|nr:universal stress protein [Streptomyces finlayi]QNE73385.1 universal stress protein [Streptomyces finlayi]